MILPIYLGVQLICAPLILVHQECHVVGLKSLLFDCHKLFPGEQC